MILYMILRQKEDGTTEYRTGGGSSTPARTKIYESLARARAYIRNRPDHYITIIDTDKTKNTL